MPKKNAAAIIYRITKKRFYIITINFLFIVIDSPVKRREKGIKSDIKPIDWKKISAIKLPLNPSKFFIF